MCTLSFRLEPDGYELYFARDERRSRAAARPPALLDIDGSRVIAPIDPEGGGAWLAVNAYGVALALLNDYRAEVRGGRFESRGRLLLGIAAARDASEVERALRARDLTRSRPFELVVFAPGRAVTRFGWTGCALELEHGVRAPLASSAVAHAEARAARRARLGELCAGQGEPSSRLLERFHREHAPVRGALSACMHRRDARTVSLARVRVDRARVAMAYAPGSPCRSRFSTELELARV